MHVTSRVVHELARLQRRRVYQALRRALDLSLARDDFRIVHLAVLTTRLELIVEADDKTALAKGMQGFQVSAARWLNREAQRSGTAFPDRYRMKILSTRLAVRAAIGGLPIMRTAAWPQTWLVQIEIEARVTPRRWIRTRADEDS